jgi:UPF0755 protein
MLVALAACAGPNGETVTVTIPRGATLAAAAESLSVHGVVRSASRFRLYARLTGRARQIRAGVYEIPRDAGVRRALRALVSGPPALRRFVVQEGLSVAETAEAVEGQLGVSADSIVAAARDSTLLRRFGIDAPSVEGYLYPSTYLVRADAGPAEVVAHMVQEFERRWRPEWNRRLDTLGMTRHEIVILASIIEGEVRHDADAAFVSSVYHNRLRAGMRLQADPTVVYALGRRRRLFEKDYEIASPYNTYLVDGLPPGPINSPSVRSLEAALYPARTDFLFFVARPDGQHVFSRTYAEHMQAIRAVRGGA